MCHAYRESHNFLQRRQSNEKNPFGIGSGNRRRFGDGDESTARSARNFSTGHHPTDYGKHSREMYGYSSNGCFRRL
jgi:hypothetical protein